MKKKVEFTSEEKDWINRSLQDELNDVQVKFIRELNKLLDLINKVSVDDKLSKEDIERLSDSLELTEERKEYFKETEESIYNKLKD